MILARFKNTSFLAAICHGILTCFRGASGLKKRISNWRMPNGAFSCGSRCQNAHIHKLHVLTLLLHVLRQFEHPQISNPWLPNVGPISTSKMPRFYGDFITLYTPARAILQPRPPASQSHPTIEATRQPVPLDSRSHLTAEATRQPEPPDSRSPE